MPHRTATNMQVLFRMISLPLICVIAPCLHFSHLSMFAYLFGLTNRLKSCFFVSRNCSEREVKRVKCIRRPKTPKRSSSVERQGLVWKVEVAIVKHFFVKTQMVSTLVQHCSHLGWNWWILCLSWRLVTRLVVAVVKPEPKGNKQKKTHTDSSSENVWKAHCHSC